MPRLDSALRWCNVVPAAALAALPLIAAAHLRTAAVLLKGRRRAVLRATSAAVLLKAHRRATSVTVLQGTSVAALPADRLLTSADPVAVPTATIGGRRGISRTTTGADDSAMPLGVTDCRPGAGAHRRRRSGMARYLRRGARHRRRSTTSASTSNRFGIPATTSGASTSSGSGFHFRSDGQPGETAASETGAAVNASAK